MDNYSIFESFCEIVDKIKKNDVLIFGWSSPERFRVISAGGYWRQMAPSYDRSSPIVHNLSEQTIDEIFVNRTHIKYSTEVNNWIKLINIALKDKVVIHWTPFASNINAYFLNGFEIIKNETKGVVNDGHFSEGGQLELSEKLQIIYDRLKNKEII